MKNPIPGIAITPSELLKLSPEEALNLILDNSEGTFLFIDRDLRIIITNKNTKEYIRRYLGKTFYRGMPVLDLAPPDRHEELREIYARVFEGFPQTTQIPFEDNGTTVWFENYFKPACDHQGNIIGVLVNSQDITERKRAQEALALQEERWRFALEGTQQGAWDWNIETGEVFYSDAYKKLYGFAETDELNSIEQWIRMVHPDDWEMVQQNVRKHLDAGLTTFESVYRMQGKDGRYRWIQSRGKVVSLSPDGTANRMIGTHTDISQKVEAQARLASSEQQYKALFQNNPLPCWIYEANSLRYLEVNEAAIDHYGFSKQEFLASTLLLIHPEDQVPALMERISREKNNPELQFNNWKHRRKDGQTIYVDIAITAINYNGIEARLVVALDVTSKVLTEIELRRSNERFSYAAKASSEALWEWDVASGEAFVSEAYTSILGWQVNSDGQFNEWHDYIHPDDREETIGGYYEALVDATIDHWEKEYRCLKKDGGYATVIDKASILRDDAGNAIRVIGAIKDVTGQKRAEEELRKSNERFILASRAASDAIFDWDLAAGKIQWGEGIEGLFGHPSAQVQPQRFESLVHPDERARVKQGLDDALAHRRKKLWKDECRFAAADGSYRHVLLRGFIQRSADGTPLRIIGSMQDISDRKYNEILLSLERTVFEMSANPGTQLSKIIDKLLQGMEQLLPGAIAAVMELKSDDSIQFIGRSRLPQEMQDKLCIKLNAADDHTLSTCCFGKQAVFTNDIASVAANDPFRRILEPFGFRACWSLPVIYSSGRVMGVLAVFFTEARDATEDDTATAERIRDLLRIIVENRWSLREIRTANERFDIAMQATHDLIWDWDLTTNEIYRDSVGLLKVYGIARRESVNTLAKWLSRVHPEDQDHVAAVVNDILQATIEKTFEVEYRFQRDDGSYANVYDRGIILRNAEGKPIRMIGAAQDITERKRLEQEVLHNELARKKAISQATIDTQERERSEIGKELHDNVNQVLTTTKLYLDLALSTPGMRDELLKKSSTNIIGVINEIRQLSRSLMDPSIGDLGLIDSIHDLIENINLTGKLRVRIRADKKAEVNLDKNQKLTIFRIIQEALNNAMRHADAKTVTLTLAVQHDTLFLEIEDDGKGFDVKSVRKGAGLKNIENRVYLINGNYSIESSINHGSLIKINFPLPKTKDKSN